MSFWSTIFKSILPKMEQETRTYIDYGKQGKQVPKSEKPRPTYPDNWKEFPKGKTKF